LIHQNGSETDQGMFEMMRRIIGEYVFTHENSSLRIEKFRSWETIQDVSESVQEQTSE
jgi:hypothetical protein